MLNRSTIFRLFGIPFSVPLIGIGVLFGAIGIGPDGVIPPGHEARKIGLALLAVGVVWLVSGLLSLVHQVRQKAATHKSKKSNSV